MYCDKARAAKLTVADPQPEVTTIVQAGKITVIGVTPDQLMHVDFGEAEILLVNMQNVSHDV